MLKFKYLCHLRRGNQSLCLNAVVVCCCNAACYIGPDFWWHSSSGSTETPAELILIPRVHLLPLEGQVIRHDCTKVNIVDLVFDFAKLCSIFINLLFMMVSNNTCRDEKKKGWFFFSPGTLVWCLVLFVRVSRPWRISDNSWKTMNWNLNPFRKVEEKKKGKKIKNFEGNWKHLILCFSGYVKNKVARNKQLISIEECCYFPPDDSHKKMKNYCKL